jgi:hypothetical protein
MPTTSKKSPGWAAALHEHTTGGREKRAPSHCASLAHTGHPDTQTWKVQGDGEKGGGSKPVRAPGAARQARAPGHRVLAPCKPALRFQSFSQGIPNPFAFSTEARRGWSNLERRAASTARSNGWIGEEEPVWVGAHGCRGQSPACGGWIARFAPPLPSPYATAQAWAATAGAHPCCPTRRLREHVLFYVRWY